MALAPLVNHDTPIPATVNAVADVDGGIGPFDKCSILHLHGLPHHLLDERVAQKEQRFSTLRRPAEVTLTDFFVNGFDCKPRDCSRFLNRDDGRVRLAQNQTDFFGDRLFACTLLVSVSITSLI